MEGKVLCGASAEQLKYYFNPEFAKIPQSLQDDLHIISVLFTEEVGGVFTIGFDEDGDLCLETDAEEDDIYYDEISAGMLVKKIRDSRQEVFEALRLYYRVIVCKEPLDSLLLEEE